MMQTDKMMRLSFEIVHSGKIPQMFSNTLPLGSKHEPYSVFHDASLMIQNALHMMQISCYSRTSSQFKFGYN